MLSSSGYSANTRSSPSGTEHHHLAARVVRRGGDRPAGRGDESAGTALALERGGVEVIERDQVVGDRALAGGADALAAALEHVAVVQGADRGRLAEVHRAVALAHVRQRRGRAGADHVGGELGADRDGEQAAPTEMTT